MPTQEGSGSFSSSYRKQEAIFRFLAAVFCVPVFFSIPSVHRQLMQDCCLGWRFITCPEILSYTHRKKRRKDLCPWETIRGIDECGVFRSGQTPAVSDYQLLEIGRRLEMYGIRLHPTKDREGTKLNLAVAHTGVLVFQVGTGIIANFTWCPMRHYTVIRVGEVCNHSHSQIL